MKRIIAYDITDDKRRTKMFKFLKNYGRWVQYSLFELEVNDMKWIEIEFYIKGLLHAEDSLCIYTLCNSCVKRVHYLGVVKREVEDDQNMII